MQRLPPEGGLGSDTSINLQETSILCYTTASSFSCSSSSLSPSVPCLLFPRQRKTSSSLEQSSQITNTCIFLSSLPGAFQYAMDFYLTFSIICWSWCPRFFPSPCLQSLSASSCLSLSNSIPCALQTCIYTITCMSGNASGQCEMHDCAAIRS